MGPIHSRYPRGKQELRFEIRDSRGSNEPRNGRLLFRLSVLEFRLSTRAFRARLWGSCHFLGGGRGWSLVAHHPKAMPLNKFGGGQSPPYEMANRGDHQ